MSRQPQQTDTDSDVIAEDPEDYARTQQLKAVFDAREQFIGLHGEFSWQTAPGAKQSRRGASLVFTALQEFILAVTPLLSAAETHQHLLEQKEYEIPDVARVRDIPDFREATQLARYEMSNRYQNLHGLQDHNGAIQPDRLSATQRREVRTIAAKNMGVFSGVTFEGIRTFAEKDIELAVPRRKSWMRQAPPIETSVAVFTDCQEALSDLGLGFDLAEEEQQSRLDDKMMEEVTQWRKENLNQNP